MAQKKGNEPQLQKLGIVNASASPQLIILMPSEYSKLHHIVGSEVLALVGY
jgi:hypothetical protein